MSELDELAQQLSDFARRPHEQLLRSEPAMSEAVSRLRRRYGEQLADRAGPRANRALLAFRLAPEKVSNADLRLICRYLARPADWEQRRLIDDLPRLNALLTRVETLPQRRWLDCFRALQTAAAEVEPALPGAVRLHNWLATGQNRLGEMRKRPAPVSQPR